MIRVSPPPPLLLLLSHNKTPPPLFVLSRSSLQLSTNFVALSLEQIMGLGFVLSVCFNCVMIYGSDFLILSDYAPSMPPFLSLPLSMACDDSDGCSRFMFWISYTFGLWTPATVNEAVMNQTLNGVCRGIKSLLGVTILPINNKALVRLLPWLAYSQNRLNSKKVFCSHIDISEPNKLNYEGNDEFIGREEQRQGGLHLGVATY
ncbi:hypothetical protein Tco_1013249 [Tanacetum coccineum]